MRPTKTPFDEHRWPETLTAHVVTPGVRPRLHGYDCEADLATNASVAETFILTLTGELPDGAKARAFEVVTMFLGPISVAEAPSHAAILARVCAAQPSGILGTAAVALAQQARFEVAKLSTVWAWLAQPTGEAPSAVLATTDEERESVVRLRRALGPTGLIVPALDHDLGRVPSLVGVLIQCGLARQREVEAVWVWSRLPAVFAESIATGPGSFLKYPWGILPFHYEEASDAG